MELDSAFRYGIYEGRTLKEVWFGNTDQESKIFKNYLYDLLVNILNETGNERSIVPFINDEYTTDTRQKVLEYLKKVRTQEYSPRVDKDKIVFNPQKYDNKSTFINDFQKILDLLFDGDCANFQHKYYKTRVYVKDGYKENTISKAAKSLLHFLPNPKYVIHEIIGNRISVNQTLLLYLKDIPIRYPKTLRFSHFDNFSMYHIVHDYYQVEINREVLEANKKYYYAKWEGKRSSGYNQIDENCPACESNPCRCSDPY